jgi:hypothetical protein
MLHKVVKLESKHISVAPGRGAQSQETSPLTTELKDFIDRAIVPALVARYINEIGLAETPKPVALSHRSTAATQRFPP